MNVAQSIGDEYLELLPVHPDHDLSEVVHYFSSSLEGSVETFVAAVGSPLGLFGTELSRGDFDLVRGFKLARNAEIYTAILKAQHRVQLVCLGIEFHRRLK